MSRAVLLEAYNRREGLSDATKVLHIYNSFPWVPTHLRIAGFLENVQYPTIWIQFDTNVTKSESSITLYLNTYMNLTSIRQPNSANTLIIGHTCSV